jgi:integrase
MPLKLIPPRAGYSANWRIRGTVRGRYINSTTGTPNKDIAEAIRIKEENRLLTESVFGARAVKTFAEAAISYVESRQPKGVQRDCLIGHVRRDGNISRCLVTDFEGVLVADVDQEMVNRVRATRCAHMKPGTFVRNVLTPLTAVLRHAAKQKWCDVPAPFDRPKYDDKLDRWATYEEADRLLAASSDHLRPLLLFLMLTGARMSEALELSWQDVDLANRWLVFTKTKNGEQRGIPIHPQLVELLGKLRDAPASKFSDRVFLTHKSRPYRDTGRTGGGQIKTAWATACRRAGIEKIRPHDLRHTFATWLMMTGQASDRIRDEIMGHASSSMGNRYAHIVRDDLFVVDSIPRRGKAPAEPPSAPPVDQRNFQII